MAPAKDERDPAQKLKDLHAWLVDNEVSKSFAPRPRMTTGWPEPTNPKAAAEVEDFQNWIKEIQSPTRLAY